MNVFDLIGPVMIGPSSSHTAGAVRLGKFSRLLLSERPVEAVITLYGSFAATGKGHGTDRALLGGILGLNPDDEGIRAAEELAARMGLSWTIQAGEGEGLHPNTADIHLTGEKGRTILVRGASVGGGTILIQRINDIEVSFTGELHTLVLVHQDRPGVVAAVTQALAGRGVNIAGMRLYRSVKGGRAIMVIETDEAVSCDVMASIRQVDDVAESILLAANREEGADEHVE